MATRQTLRDYLISIGSTATAISLPVDPGGDGIVDAGDDLGIEPATHKELMDFTRGKSLLSSYTSYLTEFNDFPIAPNVHAAPSSVRGSALEPADDAGATRVFASTRVGDNALSLDRSNSARFDAAGYPLQTLVDKTGAGSAPSGNELLSSTVAADANSNSATGQSSAVVASFAMLKKYNNFSPTSVPSSYSNDTNGGPQSAASFAESNKMRFQGGEGAYSPQISEISAEIEHQDLVNIARSMILRAAGWDRTALPAEADDPNAAFDGVDTEVLTQFPSINRQEVGAVDAFRAQDAYGMPANADGSSFLSGRGDAIQKDIGEAKYTKTRGVTNTPDTPFSENQSNPEEKRIQSLQAGIAIVGLGVLINNKLERMSEYTKEMQVKSDVVLRGPYFMGSSRKSSTTAKTRALIRSFMFQTGIYSYTNCVREGLYSCFGFSSLSSTITVETATLAGTYSNEIQNIAKNLKSEFFRSSMGLSQGFWRSVAESAIRIIKDLESSTAKLDSTDFVTTLLGMKDALAFKVMNVFAAIGYQRLIIQGVTTESGDAPVNPYDMNKYPTAPGTRQMKSRDGQLLSNASLAWRNSALPSSFILPVEALATSIDMDFLFDPDRGSNPVKGMLGSTLYDKTYVKALKNSNYIPGISARILEDRLGAEYIPFYFRDLRTNEIIAFHAFLENISDGFTANFTETKGFGRADPVQNYSNTTRGIGLTFWIVATSKEDFDEMWFKINKLTTLVYPQYLRGRQVSQPAAAPLIGATTDKTVYFEQPFSQLAGGTPVIRLRVGDLIKTNYTRSNFAKLFGVGNTSFTSLENSSTPPDDSSSGLIADVISLVKANTDARFVPFLVYAASPMEGAIFSSQFSLGGWSGAGNMVTDAATEAGAYFLNNGFVNPLLDLNRSEILKNGSDFGSDNFSGNEESSIPGNEAISDVLEIVGIKSRALLKSRSTPYQLDNGTLLRLRRPIFVDVTSRSKSATGTVCSVTISDFSVSDDYDGESLTVSLADLYVDAGQIVDITSLPGVLLATAAFSENNAVGTAATLLSNAATSFTEFLGVPVGLPLADVFGSLGRTFTSPYNNQLTRAFEDRMGEGLAGVIKSMSFTWMEAPWELDWNSRAPMACKVTLSFAPIHDIAPGLDSNGFNRAPIYNVGQIMNDTFGQPKADGGIVSRYLYRKTGAIAEKAQKPERF